MVRVSSCQVLIVNSQTNFTCCNVANQEQVRPVRHSGLRNKIIWRGCRLQKSALKLILGARYESWNTWAELETLDKRREKMCLKFAKHYLSLVLFAQLSFSEDLSFWQHPFGSSAICGKQDYCTYFRVKIQSTRF